jgi:carbonic anhydrase
VQRESSVDGTLPESIDADLVGREHLRDTVAELLHSSELISDAVAEGRVAIVGANYRLAEGTAVPDIILGVESDA